VSHISYAQLTRYNKIILHFVVLCQRFGPISNDSKERVQESMGLCGLAH